MKLSKGALLIECISIWSLMSYVSAGVHYCLISARFLKVPLYISNSKGGVFENLTNIWCTRFVRRMISVCVRSPLRIPTLGLVNLTTPFPSDSGCIVAICHTPWKRLLVQWCLENNFALVIAGGQWTYKKKHIQRRVESCADLRDVVRYLQQNGRIVIAFDVFNTLNDCPVKFLGNNYNASILPARLAKIAKVPIITALPVLRKGIIDIDFGPQFDLKALNDPNRVMQDLILFLETEIKANPGIWPTNYYDVIPRCCRHPLMGYMQGNS